MGMSDCLTYMSYIQHPNSSLDDVRELTEVEDCLVVSHPT